MLFKNIRKCERTLLKYLRLLFLAFINLKNMLKERNRLKVLLISASFFGMFFLIHSCTQSTVQQIDLSGVWQFKIDSLDQGVKEQWFTQRFTETVNLPGSMVENGKGDDISLQTEWTGGIRNEAWYKDPNYAPYHDPNNIRFPYWLQPLKKYTGAAWYQKEINIPKDWMDKSVWLQLERPHWESSVWVNGESVGMQNSLATPHWYNIAPFLKTGNNFLSIRIDNRTKDIDVGRNSHSISDHTQSNWNGVAGEISLQSKGKIYFESLEIFPDIINKTAEIKASIQNTLPTEQTVTISALARLKTSEENTSAESWNFTLSPGENALNMSYSLGENALLWDEFNPNVYELNIAIKGNSEYDRRSIDFGLREFKVKDRQLVINDRPVFLRGTLECAIFPKTGYPPTDIPGWEKVYAAVKAHGLNHVRFHSWCPPKAAFEAADAMGVYLQVECSSWANQSTTLGSGLPIDQYIWDESKRIVKAYGNHPSFVMMAYGNEPGGPNHIAYLTEFVNYWKEKDNRRIYTSGAGWPLIPENEFQNGPNNVRIQAWGAGLNSIINSQPPRSDYDWSEGIKSFNAPMVSHEIGQWCVYPNFKEIEKYTGVLKAKNFELFQESLNAHHMGPLADSFLLASGKLQALCYKADIEAALRTPGFGGFQLLDLHDFPGQGTALVGVLDPFWEEKGYISPEAYSRFCNETVPLARLSKHIFRSGEPIRAEIEVTHFGEKTLKDITPSWKIVDTQGQEIQKGAFEKTDIEWGTAQELGFIDTSIETEEARQLEVVVNVADFENSWDIWVYPSKQKPLEGTDEIRIVQELTKETLDYLNSGGTVLLTPVKGALNAEFGGDIGIGFSSIFWNTAWTNGTEPHTLGILCNPDHPALTAFPTEYHSNWQWWDAMSHSNAVILDDFSPELKPIVQVIDDWVSNRKLALLFEVKVGSGKLLVSGVDLLIGFREQTGGPTTFI